MNKYIGIDLGTSSIKLLLATAEGDILSEISESYGVSYPRNGWSEQSPAVWLTALKSAIKRLTACLENTDAVKGISFGGQMHGLVLLDSADKIVRNCILWNDGRTEKQTQYLNEKIGKKKLSSLTANIAFAGFTAPKILWVKENEPDNFARINKIMLPKDYLAYCLTGVHCTDYSDASGTLLLDVKNKCWSSEMCELCGVKKQWLPTLFESYEAVGTLKKEIAAELGLSADCIVAAGAGDNAAAAIGTGTVGEGNCNISLGTSGTVFISSDNFSVDKDNALHAFCHATGKWHLMGCILSAASANKWWLEDILETEDYAGAVAGIESELGNNSVFFLPYLMGERCPHNDVNARGAFIGLSATTTKQQMSLAVLEGVAFALRDCIEVARENGIKIELATLCGGGAKSELWKTIIANVMGITVTLLQTEQGPAYGAAILAMVAANQYPSIKTATTKQVKIKQTITPTPQITAAYNQKYKTYKKLYPTLKGIL